MEMERLPTFFILGAAKAGTTSLRHYLNQHPQIYFPVVKEPHFFDNDESYSRGIDAYIEQFYKNAESYPARGEATTSYFHLPTKVAPRMAQVYCGNPPLFIVIFRDPVERAWSHYLHKISIHQETESFEESLRLEEERLNQGCLKWVGYFSDGLYAKQLKVWLEHFDSKHFFYILNEELKNDAKNITQRLFRILGVDETVNVDTDTVMNVASIPRSNLLLKFIRKQSIIKITLKKIIPLPKQKEISYYLIRKNMRPYRVPPKMDPETEMKLRKRYAEDVLNLQEIIQRDLTSWLPK